MCRNGLSYVSCYCELCNTLATLYNTVVPRPQAYIPGGAYVETVGGEPTLYIETVGGAYVETEGGAYVETVGRAYTVH